MTVVAIAVVAIAVDVMWDTSVYLTIIVLIKITWPQATCLSCCEGRLLEHLDMM